MKAQTDPPEFIFQEAVVETGVVRDEQATGQAFEYLVRQGGERRRIGHHAVGDAGDLLDERRNGLAGIDQRRPAFHPLAVDGDQADFGDPVTGDVAAGGFEVDND